MTPEWRDFLSHAGAEIEDDRVASFGNPEREKRVTTTGNILCDLSHLGLIGARGTDTADFLQGQTSNDVRAVTPTRSQLSAYCNPKGRMLCSFRLFLREDTYYLSLPHELVGTCLQRLRMFVLRAQVVLGDADTELVRFGFAGPDAEQELRQALGEVPAEIDAVVHVDDCSVIRIPGPQPRFELYGPIDRMGKLWNRLKVHSAPVGAGSWSLLDILSGLPTIYPATSEAFVPQMANLQLIDGLSFKKGCYPGQEVVARMQYLGKLKRRMYRLQLDGDALPRPGDEIFASSDASQSVGRIVDAQAHPEGGIAALAVLQIDSAEQGHLQLGSADGPPLSVKKLPYPFESAGD
ncbi:MAG: folate-binding protein [Chromatiales bacterium]